MTNYHILIKQDGSAELIYTDDIPINSLGKTEINRASFIEFNNNSKLWEVKINNKILFSHQQKSVAYQWEIDFLNSRISQGLSIKNMEDL